MELIKMKNYTGEKAPYTRKDLLRHLKELQPEGFVLDSKKELFIKQFEDMRLELRVSSTNSFPHYVQFSGVRAKIAFTQVEDIYNLVLRDNPTGWGYNLNSSTITESMAENLSQSEQKFLFDNFVEDDAGFQVVKPMLESQVQLALQWFDQFPTLESVHYHAVGLIPQVRATFIVTPVKVRMAIIKKLLDKCDYLSYIDNLIAVYQSENLPEEENFTVALKNYLAEKY